MKLKITYTQFNTSVPRLVAKVYKVAPFGLPDGVLASIFTAKAQILSASASGVAAVIPAPAADGYTLIADSSQATGWRAGVPTVAIDDNANHLINGGFDFAQRIIPGTDTTINDEAYSADRWCITRENASLQYSRQSAAGEAGLNSRYYGKYTKITNAGKFMIFQPLTHNTSLPLRGRTLVFQLQMKASAAKTIKLAILELQAAGTADTLPAATVGAWNADNTDPTLGTNIAVVGSVKSCSVTTSWQTFSVTGTVPADSKNLIVAIWTDADYSASDTLSLAEAGLYRGSTTLAWSPRPYAQELILCMHFCQKSYEVDTNRATVTSAGRASAIAVSTSLLAPFSRFAVPMRIPPTFTEIYSPTGTIQKVETFVGVETGAAATIAGYVSQYGFFGLADAGAPYTSGVVYVFHYFASAEL